MATLTRLAWWLLAYASLALGFIGIFLPGLPTVPFILLAAFAAARGSRPLHVWLRRDRRFGPMIRDWQRNGAVSRRAKRTAVAMMALSVLVMLVFMPDRRMAIPGIVVMGGVAIWLWRRPEPR
ncbi:MAG: YbaN family protein [Pseudoxanthomonas suwonensis]|nr:YbaN family protein [Pseudoxanthomonas suwonensis]